MKGPVGSPCRPFARPVEAPPKLIAILFAVPQEVAPAARRLGASRMRESNRPFFRARIRQTEIWMAAGGMGRRAAARSTEWLLSQWTPDLLVIAGVAGALSPGLQVGDFIIADPVLGEAGMVLPVPLRLPLPEEQGGRKRARYGPLLSLDRVLVTAAEKRSAYAHATYHPYPPPLAVEMETAAVARLAEARGVRWAAVRAISDTASDELPLDFNQLRLSSGDLPVSKVAVAALTNPSAIAGLLRLGKNTRLASEALAEYLHGWLKQQASGGAAVYR